MTSYRCLQGHCIVLGDQKCWTEILHHWMVVGVWWYLQRKTGLTRISHEVASWEVKDYCCWSLAHRDLTLSSVSLLFITSLTTINIITKASLFHAERVHPAKIQITFHTSRLRRAHQLGIILNSLHHICTFSPADWSSGSVLSFMSKLIKLTALILTPDGCHSRCRGDWMSLKCSPPHTPQHSVLLR